MATATQAAKYQPKQLQLRDGRQVSVRKMTPEDKSAILEFARRLPEEDLLFLRTDITDPSVVDAWIEDLRKGNGHFVGRRRRSDRRLRKRPS
jgi:hypothetical protein